MRILVTRPQPEGERTASLLRARGHDVLVVSLLRIEPIPDAPFGPGPFGAALFTSTNAVRAIASHARFSEIASLTAYVVGKRTRAAAVAAGFGAVKSADGDVDDLARLVVAEAPKGPPFLYVAGEDVAGDLAGVLRGHGVTVETVTVYRAVVERELGAQARAAIAGGDIDAVLHYSVRSADAFMSATSVAGLTGAATRITHYCLSPNVAAAVKAAGATKIEIAETPSEEALLARLPS